MGKKRIAVVGKEKAKSGRRLVKSGKQHGRIADVGQQALVEAATIEEKAKKLDQEIKVKAKGVEKRPKKAKPRKVRGKRYQEALRIGGLDRNKTYPLPEAIKLLKKTSISRFNGSVETHLVTHQTGLKGEVKFPHSTGKIGQAQFRTEAKQPLIHQVIGKVNDSQKNLEENFQALIKAVDPKNIKKTVITSTMGPGIKVNLASV